MTYFYQSFSFSSPSRYQSNQTKPTGGAAGAKAVVLAGKGAKGAGIGK